METLNLASKKRKHHSSSEQMQGIFTRSRWEIFLHRNRSGLARRDLIHRNRLNSTRQGLSDERQEHPNEHFDIGSCISVKYLRARRVFSPTSIDSNCSPEKKSKIGAKTNGNIQLVSSDAGGNVELDLDGEVFNGGSGSDEEWLEATPPDSDICCKSWPQDMGPDLINSGTVLDGPPDSKFSDENPSIDGGPSGGKIDKRVTSVKERLGGHASYSQLKLFQRRNSLSYRRLLPFLLDIVKDNAKSLEMHRDTYIEKGEKSLEERPLVPSLDSLLRGSDLGMLKTNPSSLFPTERSKEMRPTASSSGFRNAECQNPESLQQSITETVIKSPPENPLPSYEEVVCVQTEQNDEATAQPDQVMSESFCKLEPHCKSLSSIHETELPCMPSPSPQLSHDMDAQSSGIGRDIVLDGNSRATEVVDVSAENFLQTMTLDGISQRQHRGGNGGTLDLINPDCGSEDLSTVILSGENTSNAKRLCSAKKATYTSVKKQQGGHAPCSELKLFQTPNSLSYRRLLPFLMDIAKENASALELHSCNNPFPVKADNIVGERPLMPFLDSLPNGTNLDTYKPNPSSMQHHCEGLRTAPTEEPNEMSLAASQSCPSDFVCSTLDSLQQSVTGTHAQCSDENPPALYDEAKYMPIELHSETRLQPGQVMSESSFKLKPDHDFSSSIQEMQLPCIVSPSSLTSHGINAGLSGREIVLDGRASVEDTNSAVEPFQTAQLNQISYNYGELDNGGNVKTPNLIDADQNSVGLSTGLLSCSQLKLYNTSNSFSYRRLLPFLMDLAKDSASNVSEVEKTMEETPQPLLLNSLSEDPALGSGKMDTLPLQHHFDCSGTSATEKSASSTASPSDSSMTDRLSERTIIKIPIQDPPENPVLSHDLMMLTPPNLHSVTVSQHDRLKLESSPGSEPGQDALVSVHDILLSNKTSFYSSISKEELSKEEHGSHIKDPPDIGIKPKDDRAKLVPAVSINGEPLQVLGVSQHLSQFDESVQLKSTVDAPTKDILRTQPRVCRGLCTCQTCASFRLHAEKANEFSRKQLQDAGEITVGLMKQLSCLRSLMEKSILPVADGAGGHTVIQLNQVKRFCQRASRAEESARKRLRQMTRDLNIHCRIISSLWPRVTLDHVEERLIPKAEEEDNG